jgi:hypothetical protein
MISTQETRIITHFYKERNKYKSTQNMAGGRCPEATSTLKNANRTGVEGDIVTYPQDQISCGHDVRVSSTVLYHCRHDGRACNTKFLHRRQDGRVNKTSLSYIISCDQS